MKRTQEKIQQLNLPKLNQETNLNFKTKDLNVSQSKPTFYGVTVRSLHCTERSNFFSAELDQVESSTLQQLKAYTPSLPLY